MYVLSPQKYSKCIYTKFGFLDDKDNLNDNLFLATVAKGEEATYRQCKSTLGPNKDEFPIKLHKCLLEKNAFKL